MSSSSMEDDEYMIPLLSDENNENYMETCDDEVNDIVPRLERLCISDNEPLYLPCNDMNIPGSSINIVPSSINNFDEAPISDSNENGLPVYCDDGSDVVSADADTEMAVGNQISVSGTDKILQVLPTNYMKIPGSSMNVVPSSMNNFGGASISVSNENVSPLYGGDASNMISTDAGTEMAVGSQISISGTDEISQVFSTNSPSQDFISNASVNEEIQTQPRDTKEEKILNTSKESAEIILDESQLDLSLKSSTDIYNSSFAISENENELPSSKVVPEETQHVDPETGEIKKYPDFILQGTFGRDSNRKTMDQLHLNRETGEMEKNTDIIQGTSGNGRNRKTVGQLADAISSGIVFDLDSLKSFVADISSDDQSHGSNGIMVDSPPDTPDIEDVNVASVANKSSRKILTVPSILVTNEIGQRPLVIFQPPSKKSSSDGDSKHSTFTGKDSHENRRKSKKNAKLKNENKNASVVKKKEKRPSPCKRKNSETLTPTTGKFHKRSISEHNSEKAEKTHSVNRSRSLSPRESASVANPANKNSIPPNRNSIPRLRKRANSDCNSASRVKCRKPSTSSDDKENK